MSELGLQDRIQYLPWTRRVNIHALFGLFLAAAILEVMRHNWWLLAGLYCVFGVAYANFDLRRPLGEKPVWSHLAFAFPLAFLIWPVRYAGDLLSWAARLKSPKRFEMHATGDTRHFRSFSQCVQEARAIAAQISRDVTVIDTNAYAFATGQYQHRMFLVFPDQSVKEVG